MGIFDTYGIDGDSVEVPSGGGGPAPGVYEATILKVELENKPDKKDSSKTNYFMVFSYSIPKYEYPVREYFSLPASKGPWDNTTVIGKDPSGNPITEDSNNKWLLGLIKKRLLEIGVPESKVNEVDPIAGHLNGIEVVLTLVQNKEYVNIKRNGGVRPKINAGLSLPGAAPDPVPAPSGFKPSWGASSGI